MFLCGGEGERGFGGGQGSNMTKDKDCIWLKALDSNEMNKKEQRNGNYSGSKVWTISSFFFLKIEIRRKKAKAVLVRM